MVYTHPAELQFNELKLGDVVVIGQYQGKVMDNYIELGGDSDERHIKACASLEINPLARKLYSDQSDMKGIFPQYTNMRDATKIAQELMRIHNITQKQGSEYRSLHERMVDESYMEDKVRAWAGIDRRPDSHLFKDIPMCGDKPLYTPEAGPCAPDSVIDKMRRRAMMDGSAVAGEFFGDSLCDAIKRKSSGETDPKILLSDKKESKSKIIFTKIR